MIHDSWLYWPLHPCTGWHHYYSLLARSFSLSLSFPLSLSLFIYKYIYIYIYDLYKLNLQVLTKASEDDIVTALSKAIPTKERGGLNDSKKANLIERLLILRIAKEIESDETVVKSFFDTILSKKNIGQYQYSSNKSLYSALNANTVAKAKENILSFIPKLKKKVEQDIVSVKLLGK
jgi:hypothetical protein